VASTVDLLGEATVTQSEAQRYAERCAEALDTLTSMTASWPARPALEADSRGPLPRANLSVKVSALTPLLPPDAPGRWGEELIRLAEDRGLLETWARAAPERARRFSLQRSSLELQRVYDRAFGAEQTEAAEAAA